MDDGSESNNPMIDTLENLDPVTYEVPKSRMTSASNAVSLFRQDQQNYALRSKRNALVSGLIDGNPPYPEGVLRKQGQGDRSNFNSGKAQSFVEIGLTAFYDLSNEVDRLCTTQVMLDDPMAATWSQIIADKFDELLRSDDERDYRNQKFQYDMVVYGMGFVVWDDEWNWKATPVRHAYVRLPYNTQASVNKWDRVSIEYEFTVGELWRYIANEKEAEAAGWNIEEVKRAIVQAGMAGSGRNFDQWTEWETWQRMLRDNEIYWSERSQRVVVARHLIQEFADPDGVSRITDCWVDANSTTNEFLFRRDKRFDAMSEAIAPFFYDRGTGDVHSIKGLGVKMYGLLLRSDRVLNAIVDAAYLNSTTMVQPVNASAKTNMEIVHMGPMTVMPFGFNYVPRNVAGAMQPLVETGSLLDKNLMSNLAQYRQKMDDKEGNPRTKFEIQSGLQQDSVLANSQISRFFLQLDDYFAEVFRRLVNPKLTVELASKMGPWAMQAIRFRNSLAKAGVPVEVFQVVRVKATRTVGQGSSFLRVNALMNMLNTLGGALPPEGVQNLVRDLVAAQAGYSMVSRYDPSPQQSTTTEDQNALATLENTTLRAGGAPDVTGTQMHEIHLKNHLNFADAAAASIPKGGHPDEVLRTLQASGQHSVHHLEMLRRDPRKKQVVKAFEDHLKLLGKTVDNLQKHLVDTAKQQQAQQQQPPTKEQEQAQIEKAKAAQEMMITQAEHEQKMKIHADTHAQKMAIADATAAAKIKRGSGNK